MTRADVTAPPPFAASPSWARAAAVERARDHEPHHIAGHDPSPHPRRRPHGWAALHRERDAAVSPYSPLADKSLLSQHNEDDANSPEYYVRHLGDSVVLTTLSGIHDKKNGAWYVAPPLCQPGQGVCPAKPSGAASCFSLESADHAGHYLGKAPTSDLVEMRKFPFADLQHATFCAVAAAGARSRTLPLASLAFS